MKEVKAPKMPLIYYYPDNVVLDSRQGVAIEYLVGGGSMKKERPTDRSRRGKSPAEISKGAVFLLPLSLIENQTKRPHIFEW